MAEPYQIVKSFQTWKGVHKGYSDLIRPTGYSDVANNVVIDENLDILKRSGGKFVTPQSSSSYGDFRGLFGHVYYSPSTQQRIEELLYITDIAGLFKREEETLTITYTGPPATVLLNFKPTASGVWELNITENGTSVTGFPKTYGHGLSYWSPTAEELRDLVADIDALANYTATATADSDDLGSFLHASVLPVTINLDLSGGSGTISYFSSTKIYTGGYSYEASTSGDINTGGQTASRLFDPNASILPDFINPSAVSMNNCLYIAGFGNYLMKYDGKRFYRAGLPKPVIFSNQLAAGGGALTGDYVYAATYIQKDARGNRIEGPISDDFSITLAAGGASFTVNSPYGGAALGLTQATGPQAYIRIDLAYPYYGDSLDLQVGDYIVFTTNAFVPTVKQVTYIDKTSTTYVEIGFSGNVTVAAGLAAFLFAKTEGSTPVFAEHWLYQHGGAIVNGSQTGGGAGVNTITVESSHTLRTGDIVFFFDDRYDRYVERNVTATTATTITVDGSPVFVVDNDPISLNLRIAIYRTKANGTQKYLIEEVPIMPPRLNTAGAPFFLALGYGDRKPDVQLAVKYTTPVRTPDPPPKCKFLTSHQGCLIMAGDPDNPNTVYFSEPGKPEAVPRSTNSFIVPFQSEGVVTGIGVDNGILVVFKDDARAYVHGDLAANTFNIQIVDDGIGCPGHGSIASTPVGLIWISNKGPQKSTNGTLDTEFAARLASDFKNQFYAQVTGEDISATNQEKFYLKRAVGFHDHRRQRYLCTVPKEKGRVGQDGTGASELHPTSGTVVIIYDYKNDHISFAPSTVFNAASSGTGTSGEANVINGYGGYAIFEDDLYMAFSGGWSGGLIERYGHIYQEHNRDDEYAFADHTLAIPFDAHTHWETAEEPSVFKKLLRLKAHLSLPSLLPASFSLLVKAYKDFSASPFCQFTKTFTTTTIEQEGKLVGQKAKSVKIGFSNSELHQPVRLTGYEVELINAYQPKIKE